MATPSSKPSSSGWLFPVAYTCSGLAGLVYEVTWTRLLTLHLGHTTAAASTVVGAFLLGLAAGAALAGRWAPALTRARALRWYAGLEVSVAVFAAILPFALDGLTPLFRWAYDDGAGGGAFGLIRVTTCALLVLTPAMALGATFPLAIRWFASESAAITGRSAMLYATNTLGAAGGALLAGFVLLPADGVRGSARIGMAASAVSALLALAAGRGAGADAPMSPASPAPARQRRRTTVAAPASEPSSPRQLVLAAGVLGLSGFAALVHEIAWTRILALVIGPTTYAFAAALAAVIAGAAAGSWLGTWLLGRTRQPALWLAAALAMAAVSASVTCAMAGRQVPLLVARQLAAQSSVNGAWILWGGLISTALVVPTALCLGVAFPLALAVAGASRTDATGRFSLVYATNTVGAVSGSLAAGFLVIPAVGLQSALQLACLCLGAASLAVAVAGRLSPRGRLAAGGVTAAAVAILVVTPPWDRDLMASGAYLYAPYVPANVDLEAMLTAGTLRYYGEGASATVSVKTLTGTTTLTVDGKTDASNRGDMLTQKLVAHLPLLLHTAPREVAIVGLGSGVTVGAALTHPIARADVLELSPEVVEASRFFERENRRALADPRTHLIVGDGRTHVRLAARRYDVIISEPSNPWIAGVAALFTHEYFTEARARLTPGGVFCQWANAYNIGDRDLRAIAGTFLAVFPDATAWLVGEHDVLLVGTAPTGAATAATPQALERITGHWARPGVAEDLALVGAAEPFSVLSLYVGGPVELASYAAGAADLDDDRMQLEFSAPREIHRRSGGENGAALRALLAPGAGPAPVRAALAAAGGAEWRRRGQLMARSDVHTRAYDDFQRALTLAPDDADALEGLVRAAALLKRNEDALAWLGAVAQPPSAARLVARSKLLAATGAADEALATARAAARLAPSRPEGLEQVAAVLADGTDRAALDAAIADLARGFSDRAPTHFYRAVSAFLAGDVPQALAHAERAIAADASYAPVYDLAGAAHTKLDQPDRARAMFERSLGFDAHDSTAYANLGLLALAAGRRVEAAKLFAEALWLDPEARAAREGLSRALDR